MAEVSLSEGYWNAVTKVAYFTYSYTNKGTDAEDYAYLPKKYGPIKFSACSVMAGPCATLVSNPQNLGFHLSLQTASDLSVYPPLVSDGFMRVLVSTLASYVKVAVPIDVDTGGRLYWRIPELDTNGTPTAEVNLAFKLLFPNR